MEWPKEDDMPSYAIYTRQDDGTLFRAGTISLKNAGSVRGITRAILARFPNLDPSKTLIARRVRLFGTWMDSSERLPMDPG